jgi:hypothetical protein
MPEADHLGFEMYLAVLAEVRQGDDVTRIGRRTALVGHPDLHTVDGNARGEVGQRLHAGVVMVVEILGKEEVTVLLIVGASISKVVNCLPPFDWRRCLMCSSSARPQLQLQLAELHVGADTKD